MKPRIRILAASVLLAWSPARASLWHEYNDGGAEAGQYIWDAQVPIGSGTLTQIAGYDGGQDADLFRIYIPNASLFSVTLSAIYTSQIWLFDSTGVGVAYTTGEPTPTITGALLPGAGIYYVGSSRNGWTAQSTGGAIWLGAPPGERAPDGPGAGSALSVWAGTTSAVFEEYTLNLQGAEFAVIPEPSTLLLMALGASALMMKVRAKKRPEH